MLLATALFAWAIWAQLTSRTVQILTNRKKDSVHLSVLTSPAMDIAYNPATRKAAISVRAETCPPHNCKPLNRAKFFTPEITGREEAWNTFKEALNNWRYNPLIIGQAVWAYITAWHDKRTNLTPAEFALISLELTQLEAADFALKLPPSSKRAKKARQQMPEMPLVADMAPLTQKNRPIVVEILNASGQRGLALKLTQFLRDQNAKGLLRVDVLQYDNYPTLQATSSIVDYSGRLVQVKQLSRAIGINGEIKTDSSPNVICDTRIILGKDFEMPL